MIAIDKGVPMPPSGSKRSGVMDAYRALEVGESFIYPADGRDVRATMERTGGMNASASRALGAKFCSRTVTENGERVVRVWRTA